VRIEASLGMDVSSVVGKVDGPASGSIRGRRDDSDDEEGLFHLVKRATAPVRSMRGIVVYFFLF
jgi:hypothetical protein